MGCIGCFNCVRVTWGDFCSHFSKHARNRGREIPAKNVPLDADVPKWCPFLEPKKGKKK